MRAMKALPTALVLAAALSAAAAELDFSDAILFKDDAMAALTAETLNSWAPLAGKIRFTFQGDGKDRAVWLGGNRDRQHLDVRAFDFPVYEAQVAFQPNGGALAQLELVLFSRGDVVQSGAKGPLAEQIRKAVHDNKSFAGLRDEAKARIVAAFGQPVDPNPSKTSRVPGHDQRQYRWRTPSGFVLLSVGLTEEKGKKNVFRGEYIRVAVRPMDAAAAARPLGPQPERNEAKITAGRADLGANVKREADGLVYVDNIPMVDQGDKGYCAVATLERLIRYYGGTASQHELAQLLNTADGGGTSFRLDRHGKIDQFVDDKVCHQFGFKQRPVNFDKPDLEKIVKAYNRKAATKLEYDKKKKMKDSDFDRLLARADKATLQEVVADDGACRRFIPKVKPFIDQGVPLVWMIPGHIRLLIGYNEKTGEIAYSDTWGKGHELKKMTLAEAFMGTEALIAVQP